jgi:hypothetical protein
MTSAEEIAEFISLWTRVQDVQLVDRPDEIRWLPTSDGKYSAKSAYGVQFFGSYCTFNNKAIWRAEVEGKHRLFAWLLVQGRILTVENLMVRNIQCDPVCALCDQDLETARHLCLHCVFAREVWVLVADWTRGDISVPVAELDLESWWNSSIQSTVKEKRRRVASLLIYTAWNIWKERNRRVFQGKSMTSQQVLYLIKEDIQLRDRACARGLVAGVSHS